MLFRSPWGALNLTSLDLSEQGGLVLRSTFGELPLEADAAIGFSPLEVVSSDVRIGEGKGSFMGRIEQPFDLRGDLSALSLGSLLELLPGSADLRGTGRLDGRFSVKRTVDDLATGTPGCPAARCPAISAKQCHRGGGGQTP